MNGYIMGILRYNLRADNMCYPVLSEGEGNNGRKPEGNDKEIRR